MGFKRRWVSLFGVLILFNLVFVSMVHAAAPSYGKTPPNSNPLITHKFGADPYALTYNGRVYLYLTGDALLYDSNGQVTNNTYSTITKITVISSDDLVNWTDHGEIQVAGPQGIAKWAVNSWAPAVAYKKINGQDKFFLYFANNAHSIGVLTADSPIGPWVDPLGRSLVDRSTPGVAGVPWVFDPAVLVDDDGSAYLYFGGGYETGQAANPKTARVIRLGSDMISTVGSAVTIDAPYFFESSGINKYNGKYYYSYSSNFASGPRPPGSPGGGEIAYMVSNSPMGPFTYQKVILKNPGYFFGIGGNNHHSIFEFQGQWYIAYHSQVVGDAMGIPLGYRSPHINRLYFDSNGVIQDVQANLTGVAQTKVLNPYTRVEAETFAWNGGIQTEKTNEPGSIVPSVNLDVGYINNDDWIGISNVNFGNGATQFTAKVASATNGGTIELRLDSLTGPVIGTLNVPSTGGWQTWTTVSTPVNNPTGVHHLYMIFKGGSGYLFNIDYWQFTPGANSPSYVSLKAKANDMYVAAENAGADPLIANRTSVGSWEKFAIVNNGDGTVALLSFANNRYVSADLNRDGTLVARQTYVGYWERFQMIQNSDGTVSFRAIANNKYVCADLATGAPTLIANRNEIGPWEKFELHPAP
jgi:arabinoxylan arabinofuranohydrolase